MFCKADQLKDFIMLVNFLGRFCGISYVARILSRIAVIIVSLLPGAPDARKFNRNTIWLNAHPCSSNLWKQCVLLSAQTKCCSDSQ